MAIMGRKQTLPDNISSTFYGFKIDVATGNLTFDKIDDDTMVIKLPDTNYVRDVDDYRDHFWSSINIEYQWGDNGHLEVKYK